MRATEPFELSREDAGAINAMLLSCSYVVGIRKNATGEVRFSAKNHAWDEHSSWWWGEGNMSCDCNRHLIFHGYSEESYEEEIPCGEELYTVVGIWFPDGGEIRDLVQMNDF